MTEMIFKFKKKYYLVSWSKYNNGGVINSLTSDLVFLYISD